MNLIKPIAALGALAAADAALAGPTIPLGSPLGNPLGLTLGTTLGSVLGIPLDVVPVAGSVLLLVAAASLALGIYIVRHKRHR